MTSIAEQIDKRKQELKDHLPIVMRSIEMNFAPYSAQFNVDFMNALSANGSRRSKIFAIQKLTSEAREKASPFVACSKGCSNCCYQRVMLSQTEADTIAHNIQLKAVQLPISYKLPEIDSFNSATPCPFLVAGECSIYEYRPFMCRNQVNLDKDNLLCSFENWELRKANSPLFTGIPMLAPGQLETAYRNISNRDIVGDIRDFFPMK
ncbi:YkgJ family cysteine cluster protein [Flavobacterium sp.]|uniref:YkgJ family cysteine cluster protein n=1 Tax=Flavobacterium sp. TaxID=239 RepID=UPI002608479B|nr:YkgJ family cysteine cluster protein [Flavobacterium sp.]